MSNTIKRTPKALTAEQRRNRKARRNRNNGCYNHRTRKQDRRPKDWRNDPAFDEDYTTILVTPDEVETEFGIVEFYNMPQ